jgi:hypothetical protein
MSLTSAIKTSGCKLWYSTLDIMLYYRVTYMREKMDDNKFVQILIVYNYTITKGMVVLK